MIIAIDVFYENELAFAAGVMFSEWSDREAAKVIRKVTKIAHDYIPGKFYLRELPCIKSIISDLPEKLNFIVIDGYVTLGNEDYPGLGMKLWMELEKSVPIIGVAKRPFEGAKDEEKLYRGGSTRPLYVTSAGLPNKKAKEYISLMHGRHRIPTLLRMTDQESKAIRKQYQNKDGGF